MKSELEELVSEMNKEAVAAAYIYKSSNHVPGENLPLAFGEAFGYAKASRFWAGKLNDILIGDFANKVANVIDIIHSDPGEKADLLSQREIARKISIATITAYNEDAVEAMIDKILMIWGQIRQINELKLSVKCQK